MKQDAPTTGKPANDSGLRTWHGLTLRMLRNLHSMNINELAESIGKSSSTVSRWERSDPSIESTPQPVNEPTSEEVDQLAEFFDVSRSVFGAPPALKKRGA